jgi:hypothetical protein
VLGASILLSARKVAAIWTISQVRSSYSRVDKQVGAGMHDCRDH